MKALAQVEYRYTESAYERQNNQQHQEDANHAIPWWFIAGIAGYGGTG